MAANSSSSTPSRDTEEPRRPETLAVGSGKAARDIAYLRRRGQAPWLVWLGGYRSDMRGTKAEHLDGVARDAGCAYCRFDYSGHGESGGDFEDGTIGRWTQEAEAVIDAATTGPVVLVASSMGAWVALRLVQRARESGRSSRIAGLLLIAPAPDFTHKLVMPQMTQADREAVERDGRLERRSAYSSQPDIYTKALFEDAQSNLVMTDLIETGCPITIIQGMADPDVPYQHALELMTLLPHDGVTMTLVRDGDHRLSREQDLKLIERAALDLVHRCREDV